MSTVLLLLLAYAGFLLLVTSLCKAAAAGDRSVVAPRPPVQLSFPLADLEQTDPGWVFGFAAVDEPETTPVVPRKSAQAAPGVTPSSARPSR